MSSTGSSMCSICPIPASLQRTALWENPTPHRIRTMETMDVRFQVFQISILLVQKIKKKPPKFVFSLQGYFLLGLEIEPAAQVFSFDQAIKPVTL